MKPVQPNINSLCVNAFRKQKEGEQVTEQSLQPDAEIVMLLSKHKIRVQDLIDLIECLSRSDRGVSKGSKIGNFLTDYEERRK